MTDLSCEFAGIRSPNPFWLASAPPTDKAYNVVRAFEAGWGGAVWKTLGEDPPIVNVNGPRYGALLGGDRELIGFNNIELISDRPLDVNLEEIAKVKKDWPDRPIVVSVMVPCVESAWERILPKIDAAGADGVELNLGCPHGMSERNMGAAIGQVPEYVEMVTRFAKAHTNLPVIVKLTPNITNILYAAEAAQRGGADAVSLINTINSLMGVDLERMSPIPAIDGKASHGGFCGPAVKPIALTMVADIARSEETAKLPISGMGGITTWHDAAEFLALGAGNVQVCTAAMVFGFKIVEDMIDGMQNWMDDKGYTSIDQFVGAAVPNVIDWKDLNLNYVEKAVIDQDLCIKCGRCYIACEDTAHKAISVRGNGEPVYEVIDEECIGCNLCSTVCPVENCITMVPLRDGTDPRTGESISADYINWSMHPKNPFREV